MDFGQLQKLNVAQIRSHGESLKNASKTTEIHAEKLDGLTSQVPGVWPSADGTTSHQNLQGHGTSLTEIADNTHRIGNHAITLADGLTKAQKTAKEGSGIAETIPGANFDRDKGTVEYHWRDDLWGPYGKASEEAKQNHAKNIELATKANRLMAQSVTDANNADNAFTTAEPQVEKIDSTTPKNETPPLTYPAAGQDPTRDARELAMRLNGTWQEVNPVGAPVPGNDERIQQLIDANRGNKKFDETFLDTIGTDKFVSLLQGPTEAKTDKGNKRDQDLAEILAGGTSDPTRANTWGVALSKAITDPTKSKAVSELFTHAKQNPVVLRKSLDAEYDKFKSHNTNELGGSTGRVELTNLLTAVGNSDNGFADFFNDDKKLTTLIEAGKYTAASDVYPNGTKTYTDTSFQNALSSALERSADADSPDAVQLTKTLIKFAAQPDNQKLIDDDGGDGLKRSLTKVLAVHMDEVHRILTPGDLHSASADRIPYLHKNHLSLNEVNDSTLEGDTKALLSYLSKDKANAAVLLANSELVASASAAKAGAEGGDPTNRQNAITNALTPHAELVGRLNGSKLSDIYAALQTDKDTQTLVSDSVYLTSSSLYDTFVGTPLVTSAPVLGNFLNSAVKYGLLKEGIKGFKTDPSDQALFDKTLMGADQDTQFKNWAYNQVTNDIGLTDPTARENAGDAIAEQLLQIEKQSADESITPH
ncbi:MAG TPA: hypothetical protein VE172_08995 [Stackebrandtia sp.]|uniref:hypothetical protein n=1 Tax=Stackebrandtia sp. TaxID=2023065 RepID=UPI002D518F68|nr:hypothetical protein [Stackebrandtia sp.]HZE38933.1 hypothetical protein [Stackebrandtia sp.]